MEAQALTFDLASLAETRHKETRGRRIFVLVLAAVFLIVAATGLFLILSPPGGGGPALGLGPVFLLVFGILVAGEGWYVSRGYKAAPCRVTVTPRSAAFEDASRQVTFQLDWESPRLRFRVYDMTQLPPVRRDGKPRTTDFILEPSGGPRSPIPRQAYEAIMKEVETHCLPRVHRSMPGRSGGKIVMTLVTAGRRNPA
jgi:hypothetical protein